MGKKIYVGNLPFEVKEEEIVDLFSKFGKVESVQLAVDRESGRQRGYGFVEMKEGGAKAVKALHRKQDWDGRSLKVSEVEDEAEAKPSRDGQPSDQAG